LHGLIPVAGAAAAERLRFKFNSAGSGRSEEEKCIRISQS
jgi:hypothetical protein